MAKTFQHHMKKGKALFIMLSLIGIVAISPAMAQYSRFIESGVITYEKRVNLHAKVKSRAGILGGDQYFMQQMTEQFIKTNPQFGNYQYTLAFDRNISLFQPDAEHTAKKPSGFFSNDPTFDAGNIIHTNLISKQSTTQKTVYDETFLVKDSIRQVAWKITDEFREIAGYQCRRANALVMDSVYIVAFYTDEIPVSGGPESLTGLPGMILGLALPHDNITYFATKVEDRAVSDRELTAPQKGKVTDRNGLLNSLQSSLRIMGSHAQAILKAVML